MQLRNKLLKLPDKIPPKQWKLLSSGKIRINYQYIEPQPRHEKIRNKLLITKIKLEKNKKMINRNKNKTISPNKIFKRNFVFKTLKNISVYIFIFVIIFGQLFSPNITQAATYTWTQTNFNSQTANTTGHPAPADWTEYSSKDANLSTGTDLSLSTTSGSVAQTNDGSTATGFNLSGYAHSQTATSGTGSSASVKLSKNASSWISNNVDSVNTVYRTSVYAVDANTVFVAYQDSVESSLRFAKSTDGGLSWTTTTAVTSNDARSVSMVATDANNIFIATQNNVYSRYEFIKSSNGGTSWSSPVTIESISSSGNNTISLAALDASNLFVSYYDSNNTAVKFAKSTDGGATWPTKVTAYTTGSVGMYNSIGVVDSNTIYLSYYDDVPNYNIKFIKSTNGGTNWETPVTVDSAYSSGSMKVIDANTIVVSYQNSGNTAVKFAKSTDGGATWPTKVTVDSVVMDAQQPHNIDAIDANNIFISYKDGTNDDLKMAVSTNGGSSWTPSTVETTGDVGNFTNIDAIDANNIFISHKDATNQKTKVAVKPYYSSGIFTSGSIDVGQKSNFSSVNWNTDIPSGTDLQFQAAGNNDNTTWNFVDLNDNEAYPTGVTVEEWTIQEGASASTCNITNRVCGSLFTWEDAADSSGARNLVSENKIVTAKITGAWSAADTNAVTVDGWMTGPNNYIRIYTDSTARHNGVWDNSKYRLEVVASTFDIEALDIREEYVKIDGLQIKLTGGNTSYNIAVSARNIPTLTNSIRISNNIISGVLTLGQNNGLGIALPVYGSAIGANAMVWNNIVYGFTDGDDGIGIDISENEDTVAYVYNNTVYGCYKGFYSASYPYVSVKNNISNGNAFKDYLFNATPDVHSNNVSQDATSPDTTYRNKTVSFVNAPNNNFHLASGDTNAKNQGTDLSADLNLSFVGDADMQIRSGTWDIGADEEGATGSVWPASLDGMQYFKYRAILSTANTSLSPSLEDVTLNYNYYPTSQTLISSPYNAADAGNVIGGVSWTEDADLPSGAGVIVSLRTAATQGGLTGAWTDFTNATANCTKVSTTVTCSTAAIPDDMKIGGDDQWLQYKITLTSTGANTPTVTDVTVTYVVNAPPVVTINSASQNTSGVISINYDFSDADSSSFTVSAYADLGITLNEALDSTDTTITLSSAALLPTSGTVMFDNEQITYTGKSSNNLTGCTRGANNTINATHNTGAISWAKATTASGIGSGQSSGSGKIISWTINTDYDGVDRNSSQGKVRVSVNDGSIVNQVGNGASSAFVIDTLNPVGTLVLDVNAGTATLSGTDSSTITYLLQNGSSVISGTSASAGANVWTFGSETNKTVSALLTDAYGNETTITAIAPAQPQNFLVTDITNLPADVRGEALSWTKVTDVSGSTASGYEIWRSDNGGTFELLTTVNASLNSYSDLSVVVDHTYTYKLKTIDTNGDSGAFSDTQTPSAPCSTCTITATTGLNGTISPLGDTQLASGGSQVYTITPATGYEVATLTVDGTNLAPATSYTFTSITTNHTIAVTFTEIVDHIGSAIKATSATITWTTPAYSNSLVEYGTTDPGGDPDNPNAGAYNLSKTNASLVLDHSIYLSGLTPSTTYYVKTTSVDGEDASTIETSSFTTTAGPIISGTSSSSVPVTDTVAVITWTTDIPATSYVNYSTDATLASPIRFGTDDLVTDHSVTLTGLSPSSVYYYSVDGTDGDANISEDTNDNNYYTFTTLTDQTPPVISGISAPIVTDSQVAIVWNTDENATSQVRYGLVSGVYDNSTTVVSLPLKSHLVAIDSLAESTQYYYVVVSTDANNNTSTSDEQTFTTGLTQVVTVGGGSRLNGVAQAVYDALLEQNKIYEAKFGADTSIPVVSNIQVSGITPFSATVSFEISKNAIAFIDYGKDKNYGFSVADNKWAQVHTIVLSGLSLGTEYNFKITAMDKLNNLGYSDNQTFTTKFLAENFTDLQKIENIEQFQKEIESTIESILPSLISPFIDTPTVTDITENSATINFRTNVKSYPIVEYAADDSYDESKEDPYDIEVSDVTKKISSHTIILSNLKPNTKYHARTKAFSLPQVVGKSSDFTFTTKASKIQASILGVKKDSFTVVWNTDEPTSSIVEYKDLKKGIINKVVDSAQNNSHSVNITGLVPGTPYEVSVSGINASGNMVESNAPTRVVTSVDVIAPVISNLKVDSSLIIGLADKVQTIISWQTDEPSTSVVNYAEGSGSANVPLTNKQEKLEFTINHVVILTSLKAGTIYRFNVESTDGAGNTTKPPIRTIVTPQQAASIMDIIFKNFDETFKFIKNI